MIRPASTILAFMLLLGATPTVGAGLDEGRAMTDWVARMDSAFQDFDYDGVFSYYSGNDLATIRVVHKVIDGVEHERMVHLNGASREIIRRGQEVLCIVEPGDDLLALEGSIPAGPYARVFSRRFDAIGDSYDVRLAGSGRVAGRPAKRVAIVPRDGDRFGYRLWLDEETGLLLRSELHDLDGSNLEIFQFTSLEIGNVSKEALEPSTSHGAITSHLSASNQTFVSRNEPLKWYARWVPSGFRMTSADIRRPPADQKDVYTMMFTDGLTAFSVFVESMPEGAGDVVSRNGATVAFTKLVDGPDAEHLVTIVGEIPVVTARKIAEGVVYQP